MNYQNNPVLIIVFALLFVLAIVTLTIIFIIKSRKKIFEKELERKNLEIAFERKNTLAIIEAQENERKRIAQDLHDEVSSKLIALSLNIHLLKSPKTLEEEKPGIFSTVEHINTMAIESSRTIAHKLFPPVFEKFGLADAIEEMVSDFNASKQVKINYTCSIDLTRLERENQLHLFRILQELLNNSIKHGNALGIDIAIMRLKQQRVLNYCDDGIGLDETKLSQNKGLGFINIESRIAAINGDFLIDFSEKRGFNISIHF